ncbi:MAG: acyl-ACP--UDP-N-acetylglucosamine O-acyltransferase [Candidatus Gastranaerophilales bacterium]|nr:acyl-ACP--UDP-N-acetylglucosamine O-acyltransferase [Candidatus Gastranaerophilales bacterium]
MAIHKSAIIDESAKIASNVEIGAYVVIGKDVEIADGVTIGANSHIEYAKIGENTKISPFASIGGEPQDLGYKGEKTGVIIGKNCWIREFATVNRASGENTNTIIGDNCLLMAYAHVAHNCVLGGSVIMANNATIGGHTHVGFGAWLGGMSVYHQNVRIGEMAIISGASATRIDILPYSKSEGYPALAIGVNAIGLKRKGVNRESINAIHKAIRILKSPKYNTTQAIEVIKNEIEDNEYVNKMIDFIKTSKRGVNIKASKEYVKMPEG